MTAEFSLRPSLPTDAAWIAELRAVVMRPDLERLGRFDPVRVRRRFLDSFCPELTQVIEVDGRSAGSITVRPEPDAVWIEHFYLEPAFHGQGLGGSVLREVMAACVDQRPFRLNVLQGSAARRLYERHGFAVESEDPVDIIMAAKSQATGNRLLRKRPYEGSKGRLRSNRC
nr:GNAT family N-acetyltransferase [Pseudarthrobacter psychrotolerans]